MNTQEQNNTGGRCTICGEFGIDSSHGCHTPPNRDVEEVNIGYDPASPDGDKARIVVRHPDGTAEVFVPESELTQERQRAEAETREAVLAELYWLEQAVREEGKQFIRNRIEYIERYESGHRRNSK